MKMCYYWVLKLTWNKNSKWLIKIISCILWFFHHTKSKNSIKFKCVYASLKKIKFTTIFLKLIYQKAHSLILNKINTHKYFQNCKQIMMMVMNWYEFNVFITLLLWVIIIYVVFFKKRIQQKWVGRYACEIGDLIWCEYHSFNSIIIQL